MSPGLVGLRALAESLPAGTAVPVPRELLLELLCTAATDPSASLPADRTVEDIGIRYGRAASTIRGWCEVGRFPGAYRLHGREWRIPAAAVEAFDAAHRPAGASKRDVRSLSDWRSVS